jgi:hypothetical protein
MDIFERINNDEGGPLGQYEARVMVILLSQARRAHTT